MNGNSWQLISYEWEGTDHIAPKRFYYDADFVQAKNAELFYAKALNLSTNREFKARCVFMIAKCKQQENYFTQEESKAKPTHKKYNPYFAVLKTNYSNTEFFKTAVGECSYLRDYLATR